MAQLDVEPAGGRARRTRLWRWPLGILGRLTRAVPAAIDRYFRFRLSQHAAGIAYRVLFSLAPLAIVLVSVAGVVLQNDARREDVTDAIVGWLPFSDEGSNSVDSAITRLASPTSALGLVSLVLFFWAASGMMGALRTGLEAALHVEHRRPAVRAKIVDLVLVAGAGALLIVTIALSVVAQVITRFVGGLADDLGLQGGLLSELTRVGVPLVVTTVVVMLLYRFVPSRRLRFGDAVAGGVVTGLLLLGISAASAYIFEKVSELSVIYGSLTVVLVFLYSVYLYASAVLFGASLAAVWSAPPDEGPSMPLRERIREGVLGLFVRRDPPA
jgi:membrane protein